MIPIDKVKKILDRHMLLEKELSSGKIQPKLLAKKSKEYSDLKNIISVAKNYIGFEKNKKDLKVLEEKKSKKELFDGEYILQFIKELIKAISSIA